MGSSERRKGFRFDTSLDIEIRLLPDGTPITGLCIEVGPNGMRVVTKSPLVETSYVHVVLMSASNNTYCEGRVVWTQLADKKSWYESGIDIQRWGGDVPGQEAMRTIERIRLKKDRRQKPR